jgi:hypothetical protein
VIKKRGSKVDVVAETLGGTLITQLLFIAAHLFQQQQQRAHSPRVYFYCIVLCTALKEQGLRWDFGAETLNACTSGCCLIIMACLLRTCVCVCIPSSIVIIRALISIIITPHKSARISEEALTGLENLLCVRAQSISAASFACACHLFLETASPFSQIWRRNRVVACFGFPAARTLTLLYIRRVVCAVFPFNHWLLRKDKCECCVSSAFSAGSVFFFFRNRRFLVYAVVI